MLHAYVIHFVCVAAAELDTVEDKPTAVEDTGNIIVTAMMTPGEKQVKHDDTQRVQSKDDAEVIVGVNAVNEAANQGNSKLFMYHDF